MTQEGWRMTEAALRAEVGKVERRYQGAPYPEELQQRLVAFALEQRKQGVVWRRIGAAVGMRGETLRRWCGSKPGERMVPVVVAEPVSVTLVSPAGWRLEGLSLADAIAFVRAIP